MNADVSYPRDEESQCSMLRFEILTPLGCFETCFINSDVNDESLQNLSQETHHMVIYKRIFTDQKDRYQSANRLAYT